MKKRIISLALALMMCFSLSVTAFAEDESASLTTDELDSILNPNRETILKELREQMPHDEASLLAEGLIGTSSLAKTITTTYGMRAITTTTYYYETLTMPGLQFLYVAEGWDANDYDTVVYNGVNCYRFYGDGMIIYVAVEAFYPDSSSYYLTGQYPTYDTTIGSMVTSYLNSSDTDYYYSSDWAITASASTKTVQLNLYGTKAFAKGSDEIILSHKVLTSSGPSTAIQKPTLGLKLSSTGSNKVYFNTYQVHGKGTRSTSVNIFSMIEVGYCLYKLTTTAIPALHIDDTFTLFGLRDTLTAGTGEYVSEYESISNPSDNIYSYSTSCTSPHYLNHTGDYLQVQTCFNDTPTGAQYVFTFERN